ncbi:MAG: capsular biosynthesis protein [Bacteroidia bacterium]|nr:capsular biosynthesis protein [Bacteroidia bacterium]
MGLFQNIFGKGKNADPANLATLITDLHSHLIPGVDDGVKNVEQSLELITAIHSLGFSKIITTPHVMSDTFRNTPEIILAGLADVKKAVKEAALPVTIEAAAEYYIDDHFAEKLKNKEVLTFAGNKILIELPFFNEPQNFLSVIFELTVAGYKPVLAHVERYTYWYHDFENYIKLKDRDVLFQMNIVSLCDEGSGHLKKMTEKLIDADMIDFIGSDAHSMQYIEKIKSVLTNRHLKKLVDSGRLLNHTL